MPLALSRSSAPDHPTYAFLSDFDFFAKENPEIEIDIMYRIERQDQLYKTLPRALFFSPTIVVFSALTLLLPLSGVFASGSLTVTTNNYTSFCSVPTGNLSTPNTADSTSLFMAANGTVPPYWTGASRKAAELTTQVFLGQRIPDLPQACGPNCR